MSIENTKNQSEIPIVYENTVLFGRNAPLVLLMIVIITLLFVSFLKYQHANIKATTRVTITTETENVVPSSDDSVETIPQDVIMMKMRE